jgi:hypothetical protein
MTYEAVHLTEPKLLQLSTTLISRVALPDATPVSVPMSVLLVVQLISPKKDRIVVCVPFERTVAFVVFSIRSKLSEPGAVSVRFPSVLAPPRRCRPPYNSAGEGADRFHFKMGVGVFGDLESVCVLHPGVHTGFHRCFDRDRPGLFHTFDLVAEAVPADAISARAATKEAARTLLSFISSSLISSECSGYRP